MPLDDRFIADHLASGEFIVKTPPENPNLLTIIFTKRSSPFLVVMNVADGTDDRKEWQLRGGYFQPDAPRNGGRITPVLRSLSPRLLGAFLGSAGYVVQKDSKDQLSVRIINPKFHYSLMLPLTVLGKDHVTRLHDESAIALNATVPAYVAKHLASLDCELDPLRTQLTMNFAEGDLRALAAKMTVQIFIDTIFPQISMSCSDRSISLETSATLVHQLLGDLKEREDFLVQAIDKMLADVRASHFEEKGTPLKVDQAPKA